MSGTDRLGALLGQLGQPDSTGVHRTSLDVADVRDAVVAAGRRFAHLDAGEVLTRTALHAAVAEALAFPEWYGGNLDALHDSLRDVARGTVLVVDGWGTPADAVPRTARVALDLLGGRLLVLLREAATDAAPGERPRQP